MPRPPALAPEVPVRLRRGRGDLWLLAAVGVLLALGIVMVLDVSYFHGQERFGDAFHFFRKHLVSIGVGLGAFVLVSRLRLPAYRRAALPLLILAMLGLVAVLLPPFGLARGGAQRWISLAGLSLQPSELAKLAIVVYLADSLARKGERVVDPRVGLLPPLVVVGVAAGLILLEPDFGTAVLLGGVLCLMLFTAGVQLRHMGLLVLLAAPAVGYLAIAEQYRLRRILSFLNPWRDPHDLGFQLVQSLIAFGSGGLAGVGLGESRQKMFYLPEGHTDFIFSVIGEELGLLGALGVLAAFGMIATRGLRVAAMHPDPFGRLLAQGVTFLLSLQALVNMAVVLGMLPTKGLPLPFVSYGGTAMVAALTGVGILHGLSRETG